MSKMHEESSEIERQLDLLVDGELSDAERRQLLASFDEQPGAWRRCALVFLEAQSWRREARALDRTTIESERRAVAAPLTLLSPRSGEGFRQQVAPRRSWRGSAAGLYFAMAASFLLAFGLAWLIRQPSAGPLAFEDADVAAPAIPALAAADAQPTIRPRLGGTRPWEPVTLVMDVGPNGRTQEIELPVVETTDADELERDLREPAVPAALRDALERLGHRVEEHRQFIPVELRDGRQMVVPVDDIEFLPVSARAYQ